MKSLAFVVLGLALSIGAASAQDFTQGAPPGWDGDRGLHLGRDGRWHRGWGDADRVVLRGGSGDVDATGTLRCSGEGCSAPARR
jgi:hypothetical protein